jgi:hypothetical protein
MRFVDSPLEPLIAWLGTVPETISAEFGGFVLVLSPPGSFPQLTSIEDAREPCTWILRHLETWRRSQQAIVGGLLGLTAIIDFVLGTRDTPAKWEDLMDRNSRFIFQSRRIDASLEDMLIGQRRRDEAFANTWIDLASEWKALRAADLSSASIEAWARSHFACFMGIGDGPVSVPAT